MLFGFLMCCASVPVYFLEFFVCCVGILGFNIGVLVFLVLLQYVVCCGGSSHLCWGPVCCVGSFNMCRRLSSVLYRSSSVF